MARNPRTTMTAMAQCGKEEEAFKEDAEAEAAEADDADDAEATEADDDAITESAYVVWTAVNVGWATWLPSSVLSLRMITQ